MIIIQVLQARNSSYDEVPNHIESLTTIKVFNFEGIKFHGYPKHKEFVGLGSAEIFILYFHGWQATTKST